MLLDAGVCTVYCVRNIARPGLMPRDGLVKKSEHWFAELPAGRTRYNAALQNGNRKGTDHKGVRNAQKGFIQN